MRLKWTPEEEAQLAELWADSDARSLAKVFGRTPNAVWCRAYLLGLEKHPAKLADKVYYEDNGYDPEAYIHPKLLRKVHDDNITCIVTGGELGREEWGNDLKYQV